MKMNVQIQRTAKPLYESHSSRLVFHNTVSFSSPFLPRAYGPQINFKSGIREFLIFSHYKRKRQHPLAIRHLRKSRVN